MTKMNTHWTKEELHIYILLLCAKSDSEETDTELSLIRSKTNAETFDKIYHDFNCDTEDECLEKIQDNLEYHEYSNKELYDLRKEMKEVFFSDNTMSMMERNMERILDNILY